MEEWIELPLPGLEDLPTSLPLSGVRKTVRWDGDLMPDSDAIARFWDKVVKSPSCWFFIGTISTPDGYGRFTFQKNNAQRTLSAHRFALLVSGIALTPGLVGEHHCNEPLCVRVDPQHLHASTQAENLAYAVSLGRLRGSQPGAFTGVDRVARSRRIRAALANGWNENEFRRAITHSDVSNQDKLF